MDSSTQPVVPFQADLVTSPTNGLHTVSALLDHLNEPTDTAGPSKPGNGDLDHQNSLVQVRLGIASSLFTALRAKHAPTALHCLRVALRGSSWGQQLGLENVRRDEIEVAALLHDIGKIGVPDCVLMKPGKLTPDEIVTINQHRLIGQQILLSCSASQHVLDIVKYSSAWFDGKRPGFDRRGSSLPLGARVVSILDAFDAMTSDHVYRRAMSRDRAIAELYEFAGSQFDPTLVGQFCDLLVADQITLTSEMTNRWLRDLNPETSNSFWNLAAGSELPGPATMDILFHQKLLNSMHDGVVFVDTSRRILLWNRAAERLTGMSSSSVLQKQWTPRLIGMRDEHGDYLTIEDCPVTEALSTCAQTLRRLTIQSRAGRTLSVDAQLVPVMGSDGILHGATLLLHDASSQISLERRVQTLHQKATRDPLTKVANRAEFDRVLALFVTTHFERQLPCALVMCDVDHFKKVNDTYGHPAGDEVLVKFAALLQHSCDPADLVARYGGEEFVLLYADCDNSTATARADAVRKNLSELPHPAIGNRPITASFGVTEVQAGDTPMTMLRRADRALLQAKSAGRNRVVQLGNGTPCQSPPQHNKSWLRWFPWMERFSLLEETLVTAVPLVQATERLRGFISDHHAKIITAQDNKLLLEFTAVPATERRRSSDRPISLLVSLDFIEQPVQSQQANGPVSNRTLIRVAIHPARARERRGSSSFNRARQLFTSLKSYFSAQEYNETMQSTEPVDPMSLLARFVNLFASRNASNDG